VGPVRLIYAQAALALFGVGLVLVGRLRLGQRELTPGIGSLAGGLWLAPVPLSALINVVLQAIGVYMVLHGRQGRPLSEDFAWLHWLLTGVAFAFGLLVLLVGVLACRAELELPPLPEAPVSPSDLLERAPRQTSTGISAAPAGWMTASPPPAPEGIVRVRATGEGLPAEVEALGQAEGLYRPWALCGWLGMDTPTYIIYPEALVIAHGDEFVVVPWGLAERLHQGALVAAGEKFEIASWVLNRDRMCGRINDHIARRLVPRILRQVRQGERATFGPLTVDQEGILFRGKRAEWDRVLGVGADCHSVLIRVRESMLPWSVPLAEVPNAVAFVALVQQLQPGLQSEVV
jgi:hypothetical protein